MQSIKNHLSLVIALLSILFSMQIFIVVDRSLEAYKQTLVSNYSMIIVSQKKLIQDDFISMSKLISDVKELPPDNVVERLNTGMEKKNLEFLKLTLPKFYKLTLEHYPSPFEIDRLTKALMKNPQIVKVENFAHTHDITYKLLLLLRGVVSVFAVSIFIVTSLLIFKELKIWQLKHSERMSIMSLFGAPIWLRSAVLFRLAIVDALVSSALAFALFDYLSSNPFILEQFENIDIHIVVFNPFDDFILLVGVSLFLSILLASFIVLGHKEEV